MARVAIAGGPRTGKTTYGRALAAALGVPLVSTDDHMASSWEAVPDEVVAVLSALPEFVLEGVQAGRVLRRWYRADPSAPALDVVVVLDAPLVPRTPRQEAMARGCASVLRDVLPGLPRLGTEVRRGLPGEAR